MSTNEECLARARLSLEGLSVGDAFGDQFFMNADEAKKLIDTHTLPDAPWLFTDDTNMALSIYHILKQYGDIHQDALADSFANNYDLNRGYGPAMHRLLAQIGAGQSWKTVSSQLFEGQGSYGNGAAMRVAPIGAYFADDLEQVIEYARRSGEVTHTHPEGIAGTIAVAVAAALAARMHGSTPQSSMQAEFLTMILPYVPESEVKSGIIRARDLQSTAIDHVVGMIGNGYRISAQDTIPFALWCASHSLDNFENALWLTASGFGDVDTNCAIVGGIVALFVGSQGLPSEWIQRREPLPLWALG